MVDPQWDEGERFAVYAHLRHGLLARAFLGQSRCRMCEEQVGNAELTDGAYVWPEGLAHYVRHHGVRLPVDFVNHVRALEAEREAVVIDTGWWQSVSTAAG